MRAMFLFFSLLQAGRLAAQPAEARLSPEVSQAIERIVASSMERNRTPAVSVALSVGGLPVWSAAWGVADLENNVPATPRSVFRIGSISKPFTAVAAMMLTEQGMLDLDAEVQRYVPSFPRKRWPVTVRDLLRHQAGVRNYQGDEFFSTRHYSSIAESLSVFSSDPLIFEPGTKYAYTTYGFNLVGAAVEAASGTRFDELIALRIATPAGMATLRPDNVYAIVPYRVRGYRRRGDGTLENCALVDTSNKLPGGGWVATASDLILFARALMNGSLLPPEALERMWTPHRLRDGSATGYGLGWGIEGSGQNLVVQHSGTQSGVKTHLLLAPNKKVAVAVLANLEEGEAPEIAKAILAVLLEAYR